MNEFNVTNRIVFLYNQRHWTKYRLAKECGLPLSTINTILSKSNMPTLPTIHRICDGFGITLSQFFQEDNKQSGNNLSKDQTELLAYFQLLNSEDKTIVKAYAAGLAKQILEPTVTLDSNK